MTRICEDCVVGIVELDDGWIATQVASDIWKLENPDKQIGIATFSTLDEIIKYLKED